MQEISINYMFSTLNSSNLEMPKHFETAKLRILQHNCNRSTNVMQTILEYTVKNANIVLLQESWIENDNISISHFAFTKIAFNNDNQAKFKARIMTFISKSSNINCISRYDISNDSNIQMLDISSNNENLYDFQYLQWKKSRKELEIHDRTKIDSFRHFWKIHYLWKF